MNAYKKEQKNGGKTSEPQHEHAELLQEIREFTKSIVKELSEGRLPLISINRSRNYCSYLDALCSCSYDLSKGQEILTLEKQCHVHRIDVFLRVLLIVQQLLQENRHWSKRYLLHASFCDFSAAAII